MFQSLFYWIYYFYNTSTGGSKLFRSGFNPYFTGYTTFTEADLYNDKRDLDVSILILLDILLLQKQTFIMIREI